jgi:1-acyl-sn-glycerol-3-phosphate acyltransferase
MLSSIMRSSFVLTVFAVIRMFLAAVTVTTGAGVILLGGLAPLRVRGVRLASWIVLGISHLVCRIFQVRVICNEPATLRGHLGFVFPNHLSALDPLVLLSLWPMRFVAAVEVMRYPVVGWITKNIGTVFVARQDRDARKQARGEIVAAIEQEPQPPIVLFPEGRLGPGHQLYPFRYGAFAMAVSKGISYIPCGLRYRPLDVVVWHGGQGEKLLNALWRLARNPGPVLAEVIPLAPVFPQPTDDPAQLAMKALADIAAALSLPTDPATPPALPGPAQAS